MTSTTNTRANNDGDSQSGIEITTCVDWLTVTIKQDADELQSSKLTIPPIILNNESYSKHTPRDGYNGAIRFDCGIIQQWHTGRRDMGTNIICNGGTLKTVFDTYGLSGSDLLLWYYENGHTVTRVDYAVDVKNCPFTVIDCANQFRQELHKSRARTGGMYENFKGEGNTLYVGSKKRRHDLTRIYDKGAREIDKADWWIRIERQLGKRKGNESASILSKTDDRATYMSGMALGNIDFPQMPEWSILDDINPIEVNPTSPDKEPDTKYWLLTICAKSLAKTMIQDFVFLDEFLDAVQDEYNTLARQTTELSVNSNLKSIDHDSIIQNINNEKDNEENE